MMRSCLGSVALAALLPVCASAQDTGVILVLPPGSSSESFVRPSNDPLAAAAAAAMTAGNMLSEEFRQQNPLGLASGVASDIAFGHVPEDILATASVRPLPKPLREEERSKLIATAMQGSPFDVKPSGEWKLNTGVFDVAKMVTGEFVLPGHPAPEPRTEAPALVAQANVVEPEIAQTGIRDVLKNDLLARYASDMTDAEMDIQRVRDIASIDAYTADYGGAVSISDEPMVAKTNDRAIQTGEVINGLMSERLMQIREMQAMIGAYPQPAQNTPMAFASADGSLMRPAPNTGLDGVPGLDYRGELPDAQIISANDVPAGSQPFAPAEPSFAQGQMPGTISGMMAGYQAPAEPVIVGDGENLVLRGWSLGLTGSGQIGMYIEGDPNSVIELSEGMVIGGVGEVLSAVIEGDRLVARFDSGESLEAPVGMVRLMNTGVQE